MKADRANYLARFILPSSNVRIIAKKEKPQPNRKNEEIIVLESKLPILGYKMTGTLMNGTIEKLRLTMTNGDRLLASFEPPLNYEDGKLIVEQDTSMRFSIEKSSSGESEVSKNLSSEKLYEDLKIKIQENLSEVDLSNLPQDLENDFPKAFTKYLKMMVFTKENDQKFNEFIEAILIICKNSEKISLDDLYLLGGYKTQREKLTAIKNSLILSLSNVKSILKAEDSDNIKIEKKKAIASSMNEIRQLLQEHYKYFKMFLFERST